VRGRHSRAGDPALFLGTKGRLGGSGVLIMMRRRGRQAGIEKLHPHLFRHTWAHEMLADGAAEGDVAALGGWKSRGMLDRYGSIARQERAIEAHRRHSPASRLRRK
jgi:integrase